MNEFSIRTTPELQKARAAVSTAQTERDVIQRALDKARADARINEADIEAARAKLADAESGAALAPGAQVDPRPRKALLAARDEGEVVQARIRGLEARLALAEAAVSEARMAAAAAWRDFTRRTVERYIEEHFLPALHGFVDAVRLGHAIGAGVNDRHLLVNLRGLVVPDFEDPRVNLVNYRRWELPAELQELQSELAALALEATGHAPAEAPQTEVAHAGE